jgi:hypothetical protein
VIDTHARWAADLIWVRDSTKAEQSTSSPRTGELGMEDGLKKKVFKELLGPGSSLGVEHSRGSSILTTITMKVSYH